MNVLIVGLGSIAKKHINALQELYANDLTVYALRHSASPSQEPGVTNLLPGDAIPEVDFVLISNPTGFHADSVERWSKLGKPIFLEKPPVETLEQGRAVQSLLKSQPVPVYVGFNMRFHPVIQYLKHEFSELDKVLEVKVYCGSYLPDWRPGYDYKYHYGPDGAMGTGVHLELIHELDYTRWIFGEPQSVHSHIVNTQTLGIAAADYAHYLFSYPGKSITIDLNYYRRDAQRYVEVVTQNHVWKGDLRTAQIFCDGKLVKEWPGYSVLETYTEQLKYFCERVMIDQPYMNNFDESLNVMKICLPNEKS